MSDGSFLFIFMLTQNDETRADARAVYEDLRTVPGLQAVGFKDLGISEADGRALVADAHADGREVFLEVVSPSAEGTRRAAELSLALGADYLIGTFPEHISVAQAALAGSHVRLMPYVGRVFGHPCNLDGSISEIVEDARRLATGEVNGLNVLAYRHVSLDGTEVAAAVTAAVSVPIIVAGSVIADAQIRALKAAGVWAFTVGGAVFERRFVERGTYADNVAHILEVSES